MVVEFVTLLVAGAGGALLSIVIVVAAEGASSTDFKGDSLVCVFLGAVVCAIVVGGSKIDRSAYRNGGVCCCSRWVKN